MSVYVGKNEFPFRRMKMCHMIADTNNELMEMAEKLRLKPEWLQLNSFPHFDICKSKRSEAIRNGAIEASNRMLVDVMKRYYIKKEKIIEK